MVYVVGIANVGVVGLSPKALVANCQLSSIQGVISASGEGELVCAGCSNVIY